MSHHCWTPLPQYTFANRTVARIGCRKESLSVVNDHNFLSTFRVRHKAQLIGVFVEYTLRAQRKSGSEIQRDKLVLGISTLEKFGGWGVVLRLLVKGWKKIRTIFYYLIPMMVIVRLRSVEICMPMSLGRDRGSATKKSDKVRTLGRVRLRVCECVSHDTRHFRRIHASGLDRGSLLPLQKVDIPSPRIFKAAPVP